jgi:hypothetical protein
VGFLWMNGGFMGGLEGAYVRVFMWVLNYFYEVPSLFLKING